MNRRAFLSLFGLTAGAIAADPDALLWTPGAKMISIPAVTPASTFRIHDLITIDSVWVRNPITGKAVVGLHQLFRVHTTGILVPFNVALDQANAGGAKVFAKPPRRIRL